MIHQDAYTHSPQCATANGVMRLLYVEDNRLNALLFEEALRVHANVHLRVAGDAQEALAIVREWQPDILVLDAQLPGTNGFELLHQLRQQPGLATVPAIMCSADTFPEEVERARLAGFIKFWPKPINLAQIFRDLHQLAEENLALDAQAR